MTEREYFLLVDRSQSMMIKDDSPAEEHYKQWTRWNSAKISAENISEVILSLAKDDVFKIMLWHGKPRGDLAADYKQITDINQINGFFKNHKPKGNTPLAAALKDVSKKHLLPLLKKEKPFTVVILTDGAPNCQRKVENFFKKLIKDQKLERPERKHLAAFSFIRVGDDPKAIQLLEDLDQKFRAKVDIINTKEDSFLFGTGKHKFQYNIGPFELLRSSIQIKRRTNNKQNQGHIRRHRPDITLIPKSLKDVYEKYLEQFLNTET